MLDFRLITLGAQPAQLHLGPDAGEHFLLAERLADEVGRAQPQTFDLILDFCPRSKE